MPTAQIVGVCDVIGCPKIRASFLGVIKKAYSILGLIMGSHYLGNCHHILQSHLKLPGSISATEETFNT